MRAITDRLEQAGIGYMPLKGSVKKKPYPKREMRQMSDVDILIDAGRAGKRFRLIAWGRDLQYAGKGS